MSFKLTASALPNLYPYGSYVYLYIPIWTATPNSSLTGYSYSSAIGAYWRGTSYVGGGGAYANTATGVAQYLDTARVLLKLVSTTGPVHKQIR